MLVTMQDFRTCRAFSARGFCAAGGRRMAETLGLDWGDFVRNGIDAEKLEATCDPFALALVKWARERAAQEASRG